MKKIWLWMAGIFVAVVLCKFLIVPVFDRIPPINEATKTCLVTGASSGIGLELSKEMIKKGWKVIGVARREEKLRNLVRQFGSSFIPYVCDVSDANQIISVSNKIKDKGLSPTLFFLNAGIGEGETKSRPFFAGHKKMFDTNYFGVIAWVEKWLPEIEKRGGGTFVATSSVSSLFAVPGAAGYSASKAALNAFFQSFRLQYHNDNVGFIVVLPGPVDTSMLKVKKPLPFTHKPEDEAKYIIRQVFKRKKQIEPSWIYSWMLRALNWLPDRLAMKFLG